MAAAASAAACLDHPQQFSLLLQPHHPSSSLSASSCSDSSPHCTPFSCAASSSSLGLNSAGGSDQGQRPWVTMAKTPADDAGGGGGVLLMLQRAFCSSFASSTSAKYRTVLTRASMDSGLELDELERNSRAERRKHGKRREQQENREDEREKMLGEGDSGKEREKRSAEKRQREESRETTADRERAEMRGREESNKRCSVARLLSVLRFSSSANTSPTPPSSHQRMFDFPLSPSGDSVALSSPVAQLSHANAVLVQENELLKDRVRELELMLHDHVAHINSIYHTLHTSHGFHALRLPDGELVPLSQFRGFPLHFICKRLSENEGIGADEEEEEEEQLRQKQSNNGTTLLGGQQQARRFLLQQRQRRRQRGSVNESHSLSSTSGSSSSFASSSSTFDSSFAADPTDLSHAMMRRLCIRPVAGDNSDEIQAFMEWLKSGGGTPGDESLATNAGGTSANLSPSADAANPGAWPPPAERAEEASGALNRPVENGMTNCSRPVENGITANGTATAAVPVPAHRSQRQPPVYSVMSKSQRIRTQFPSLGSRHRSPLLSAASSSSSFLAAASAPSSASHHHHASFGGSGASSVDETARSPRRGGIGITNMGRMGSRPSDAHKTAQRHLI